MTRQKNGKWKLTDSEMNLVCIWAGEAAKRFEDLGLNALANTATAHNNMIFKQLQDAGLYDEL